MTPDKPGRYRLQMPDGGEEMVKVIEMNGEIYAVVGFRAVPIADVQGTWL